jgi:hypothetical protein
MIKLLIFLLKNKPRQNLCPGCFSESFFFIFL